MEEHNKEKPEQILKYPHRMSCPKITFETPEIREWFIGDDLNNSDIFFQEIQSVFLKYGVKSANLIYDVFDTAKDELNQ